MNQNDLYQIEGLNFTKGRKTEIYITQEPLGFKLLDPLNLSFKLLVYWSDETVLLDWNDYIEGICSNGLYFRLIYQGEEYKIHGSTEQLDELYYFCSGKFIFQKSNIFIKNSVIQTNSQYELNLITNVKENKQYIEKRIFSSLTSQRLEMSNSFNTQLGQDNIPEEVRIIQLLNAQNCPYIMKIQSITYDGDYYSLIYTNKNLISLKQILKMQKMGLPLSFVIEILEQLLIVLNIFQELQIIHNGINLDMINYSLESNSIVVCNFSSSTFECNKGTPIKGNTIGFIPPEYLNKYLISPQANIFQLGTLLYHLLFNQNPFGNDPQTQLQNNISGKYNILNTNVDKDIIDLLKSMMQINPQKRKTPKEYLCSKIFKPQYRSKISKNSFLSFLQENRLSKNFEFEVENENPTIQNIKSLSINKKKN
ncbi:unnamed protein product (macronuclear) [Paramecium tetraurelia]|uniref:Protein kinase domain-containing protein n=1 Tax=Paramecium tetraurelia TaxID=5888 RepID=A0EFP2_PARTE|nr:uncharacterized protein GSPATT00026456001 [Paramecium tetraurelia]CAK94133.1 unnamed protein product [Paramecium tetraurelia]|eukprot:XP_001461506.1 hypothetical protein (macronuclear) [Paramecium tetraurelia strain d4-2]